MKNSFFAPDDFDSLEFPTVLTFHGTSVKVKSAAHMLRLIFGALDDDQAITVTVPPEIVAKVKMADK